MTKFNLNIQLEVINYTEDRVFWFEDLNGLTEGTEFLEQLREQKPEDEIGVSHFTVNGVEIPFNEENVEYLLNEDDAEIAQVMTLLNYGYGDASDLSDVIRDVEYKHFISVLYADNEEDAFMEYYEEIGLMPEIPERIVGYIDWEKLCRDFTFDGLTIVEIEGYYDPEDFTKRAYLFIG